MIKIIAQLNDLEALAQQVVPILQSFASNRRSSMFDDFSLNDVHNALVMFKALEGYENPYAIKHILKSPIHASGIKGAITKSLYKLGISGVAADFHEVLDDFHQSFLATEELRTEMLPKGFLIVKYNTDHNQDMLAKDEYRKAERKRQMIGDTRKSEAINIKF